MKKTNTKKTKKLPISFIIYLGISFIGIEILFCIAIEKTINPNIVITVFSVLISALIMAVKLEDKNE